jgi:PqqD family protein of HPr-rel-A system
VNEADRPVRHPAIETAVFNSEAVLYDERSGTVHHLNASAYAIWALLDGRLLEDAVTTLSETTGVPPPDIRRDVLQIVSELGSAGLLAG